MDSDNVAAIKAAYDIAERKDLDGWIAAFTEGGRSPTIRSG